VVVALAVTPLAPSFRPLNVQPGARWSRLGLWWVRSRIVRASMMTSSAFAFRPPFLRGLVHFRYRDGHHALRRLDKLLVGRRLTLFHVASRVGV